jgi:hypothetical protein
VTAPSRKSPWMAIVGTVLVLAGLAAWALYVKTSGDEPHAYARGGKPPQYVEVKAGETYRIAIRGGVGAEALAGIAPADLSCTAAAPGQAPGALNLTDESTDTKATNDIASFVSAINGRLHVECTGLGPVFVDNAEDAAFDWASFWLVVASLALIVGTALVLSALRAAGGASRRPDQLADVSPAPYVPWVDPTAEEFL